MNFMPDPHAPRLMADPSLLLSAGGQQILEENAIPLVVSQTFLDWLGDGREIDAEPFRADDPDAVNPFSFIDRVRELVQANDVPGFSYETALAEGLLDDQARLVLDRILARDDPLAQIDADQWAFLNSHSWLGSQARRAFHAFREAGAVVLTAGREIGLELLGEVIPLEDRPEGVNAGLILLGVVKWLVVGGATIGGGALGGIAGTFVGGPVGGWIGEQLGEHGGEALATAAVVAIDP
ncbi:MAG TPA: hypothetical protein VFX85_07975 [Solirubrobacterales bacterium]|nr:hypothetical protein [Solirubrobacterales bacterium]